jgi:hypothetical protein
MTYDSTQPSFVRENWHLFATPLTTLLTDVNLDMRARALKMVPIYISKCGIGLILRTGLSQFLQTLIFPGLAFLPESTPLIESIAILEPTYEALIYLSEFLQDGGGVEQARDSAMVLDRLIREGITNGYRHAGKYPDIVEILMRSLGRIVSAMGFRSSKHLKVTNVGIHAASLHSQLTQLIRQDLLPIYWEILTDPFASHHYKSVTAAIDALGATLVAVWPRILSGGHVLKIMEMISLCWLNMEGTGGVPSSNVRANLQRIRQLLSAISASGSEACTHEGYVMALVRKEPWLTPLLSL